MKKTTWVLSGVMVIPMLLAGCGSLYQSANTAPRSTTNTNTTLSKHSTGSIGNKGKAANASVAITGKTLVKQAMQLAEKGKVLGIPFSIGQNIETVHRAWGNPDSQTSAGAGIYASYGRHSAAFGMNKGEQIFDVRLYGSQLHSVTLADVEAVLGKPGDIRSTSDSAIYMYPAGPDDQILWMFSKSSDGTVKKTVDHVSVFWPQGTVNTMAATQPAPSVVMDNAPGTVGSLFTFSIQNPPKGYGLVEMEWLPISGTPVVNTFTQAVANGQSGNRIPGFGISGDGQTLSFVYPSSMNRQMGKVRVIYQAVSGAAMIGNSSKITLK